MPKSSALYWILKSMETFAMEKTQLKPNKIKMLDLLLVLHIRQ